MLAGKLPSQVRLARDEVQALLDSGVPVPLRLGLGGALCVLAATSAIAAEAEMAVETSSLATHWPRPYGWSRQKL